VSDRDINCGWEKRVNCFGACIGFFAAKADVAVAGICDKADFSTDI
jgi:hypothetical protein